MQIQYPHCKDSRECFARKRSCECTILLETPADGKCTFCKADRYVTNEVRYPLKRAVRDRQGG